MYMLEGLTGVTVFLFLVFQVLIPIARGTTVFPVFRRERKLVADLADSEADVEAARIEREISVRHKTAEKIRHGVEKVYPLKGDQKGRDDESSV